MMNSANSNPKNNPVNPPVIHIIVPAAGIGQRMQSQLPKQYLQLANGKTVLQQSIEVLQRSIEVLQRPIEVLQRSIEVLQRPIEEQQAITQLQPNYSLGHRIVAVAVQDSYWPEIDWPEKSMLQRVDGGDSRAQSVLNALQWLIDQGCGSDSDCGSDWVLVHDAARPCVSVTDIQQLITTVFDKSERSTAAGAILALPANDTVKMGSDSQIISTLDRSSVWLAQTPQMFPVKLLYDALLQHRDQLELISDEASAMENCGHKVALVKGHPHNIKITQPGDMALANHFTAEQQKSQQLKPATNSLPEVDDSSTNQTTNQINSHSKPLFKVGSGFDVHAFTAGDHFILGGVRIPWQRGIAAHSDGDVLLHALCDALLGACALGDIGQHFSDKDPRWHNVDSRLLLKECHQMVRSCGYQISNIDISIMAQAPQMSPHILAMRNNISADLKLDITQVSIKATTTEKLGFVGRQEGLAVQAQLLLQSL